jgi:hypothetical protein
MDEHDVVAEAFEAQRTHLQVVAYRMLGSLSEADDAVQESWLRLSRSDTSAVPGVVLRADRTAVEAGASAEVRGAPAVAETFSGRARVAQSALVNGAAGAVWAPADGRVSCSTSRSLTERWSRSTWSPTPRTCGRWTS